MTEEPNAFDVRAAILRVKWSPLAKNLAVLLYDLQGRFRPSGPSITLSVSPPSRRWRSTIGLVSMISMPWSSTDAVGGCVPWARA